MLHMIIDLQFGSTGKGLLAGYLALKNNYDTVMTAWAPNAGHTFIEHAGGHKWIHTMLANGIVSKRLKRVLLGPGSLINPEALAKEISDAHTLGYLKDVQILIHPHAAVVLERHREEEALTMTGIGSTKKGVGAAMADRIARRVVGANVAANGLGNELLDSYVCTMDEYNQAIDASDRILIEGAQGFSLSMYHGFYPYCTSRDVTPFQILADVGMPLTKVMMHQLNVFGTMRTCPIRVANRYNESGDMVGWSGPCYDDQVELDWEEDFGMKPELTTVTKLPRRIFSFSEKQTEEAIRMCAPNTVFLNFANYVKDDAEFARIVYFIDNEMKQFFSKPRWIIGTGPTADDVHEVYDAAGAIAAWKVWSSTQ